MILLPQFPNWAYRHTPPCLATLLLRVLSIPICTFLSYGICKYFLQPCRSSFHYFGGIFEVQSCVTLMKPICLGLDCTLVSNLRVKYLILSHSFISDTQRYAPFFLDVFTLFLHEWVFCVHVLCAPHPFLVAEEVKRGTWMPLDLDGREVTSTS